ncbi:Slp family lipoprotein [Candidatus Nitronereus thalassa]|uniref:Slp family lipoprotein n=1 Tax=Candidatus Nitronereus thalassa TaxID=3020898 RepID=A0ABU3K4X4_9BACT|nr:Slp family lipoprotein [Candidatus Nitronereus thalassa]MDT7041433.1 Slp family lipoprotein [Candidatus Nitronereus thalassa]
MQILRITLLGLPLLFGCATGYHEDWLPQETLAKIDPTLNFDHLKDAPESHEGKTLVLGGEILEAKRMKEYTRLVILQLPLDNDYEPVTDRMKSQGRFVALERDFLDPAIVPAGTRVTIVGSVSGSLTEPLDEMEYTYPTIAIDHLKTWPKAHDYPYGPYSYRYRPYWYGPYFWDPYYFGPYGRPYYFW